MGQNHESQDFVDRAQPWAIAGLIVFFLAIVTFAFLPPEITSVVFTTEEAKPSREKDNEGSTVAVSLQAKKSQRDPASVGGPDLKLRVFALEESLGQDFHRLENSKRCIKDPTCQLDDPAFKIYMKIKDAQNSLQPEVYKSWVRQLIDFLLGKMERDDEARIRYASDTRKVLQDYYKGQEDCWSCEGAQDFERVDSLLGDASKEQSIRRPMGLDELLERADEAYQSNQYEEARRFYSEVLQILDERDLTDENMPLDEEALSRVQNRCLELECRS